MTPTAPLSLEVLTALDKSYLQPCVMDREPNTSIPSLALLAGLVVTKGLSGPADIPNTRQDSQGKSSEGKRFSCSTCCN